MLHGSHCYANNTIGIFTFEHPHSVSLNEYIEIAKAYSTQGGMFINGILDAIVKNQNKKIVSLNNNHL